VPAQLSQVGYYLKHRFYAGALKDADAVGGANIDGRPPEAVIYLKASQGRIASAGFQASGCGHLIACCSALLDLAIGRRLCECLALSDGQLADHLGGLPPTKQYCAGLAVLALRNALAKLSPIALEREPAG